MLCIGHRAMVNDKEASKFVHHYTLTKNIKGRIVAETLRLHRNGRDEREDGSGILDRSSLQGAGAVILPPTR